MSDFRTIYRDHAAFVWRSLRRLGVRDSDVEDATQEVFVVVHRKLREFAGRSSVKTWVFGICIRVAADWRKKAHIRRETEMEQAPERTVSGEMPVRQIAQSQARAQLEKALELLDDDKRTVFVLFELEQLSMHEVAEALNCPLQTAYARLYAARRVVEAFIAQNQPLQEVAS